MSATPAATGETARPTVPSPGSDERGGGIRSAYRAERRKLTSQLAIRLLALVCALGPFVFAGVLKAQSGTPSDTLYGGWIHSSGFAFSLVVLGFAGSWGFPLVAGIVAGDLFSSEDRYGTWKLVLTRSCTRRDLFAGKALAAATFSAGLVTLTAAASLAAGTIMFGAHSLVSLSGTVFSPGRTLLLVIAAWLITIVPALAFASVALLVSTASRNGIVGVLGPALLALATQLLLLVGKGVWVHVLLVGSAFSSWAGLFTAHAYFGLLVAGIIVSLVWIAVCLAVTWRLLRRRDFAGTPVTRRPGWIAPVRATAALTVVIVALAAASNLGPAGVTAHRLQASLVPAFNRLTLLQQSELGRQVRPGEHLNIVLSRCIHRGTAQNGPGDWACTMNILIPQSGSTLPPEPTPVTYDVSVQSNGCYKAESPPAFVGPQTIHEPGGHTVVNPLFTIYGCFNVL